jgi:hypothetical protein
MRLKEIIFLFGPKMYYLVTHIENACADELNFGDVKCKLVYH